MPQRVFVTGGSGFVGGEVVKELLARGCHVRALVNRRRLDISDDNLKSIHGELTDPTVLDKAILSCDAVVHLVGIILENPKAGVTFQRLHVLGTRTVVDSAQRCGVKRYVHMSALGTRPRAVSRYHRTKFEAEQIVKASELNWTIFRPSLIHGPKGEFLEMEIRWARGEAPPYLFMPYFGAGLFGRGGAGLLEPIHVQDVARAFCDALYEPQTIGHTYELAGAERVTWPQLHAAVAKAVGSKKRAAAIPAWIAKLLTHIAPARLLPFNRDQVEMSQEDNTCDLAPLAADFGFTPRGFTESLQV